MKYDMRHAKNDSEGMKHVKKEEKEETKKVTVKRKTVFACLGIIALIAIAIVVVLNFQLIYGFIDSNMANLKGMLFGSMSEEDKEAEIEDKNTEGENDTDENLVEDKKTEVTDEKENSSDENNKKEETLKAPPTIELEVYEGPLYAKAGDVCYYRVKANVTGEPLPEIKFSKDDSLGSLGPDKAQINISRDGKQYILTAVAESSEGKAADTMTLIWNCNASPEIKGISLSSSTLYVGEQYDVSIDALDPDGDVLSYAWSVAGGSITDSTANPTKWNTPDAPGDYSISVTVSDGRGNTSNSSIAAYVGEVVVEEQTPETPETTTVTVSREEDEGGYIEKEGIVDNGGMLYAGDSVNDKSCMGFVSFDISELSGGTVQSAILTLSGVEIGEPLPFFEMLNINVLSWGERPIKQSDFSAYGIFVASYDSRNISCNVSKLKGELQKAINNGKSRFQIRIHFSGPQTDYNGQEDGWKYNQSNVNLNVTITK